MDNKTYILELDVIHCSTEVEKFSLKTSHMACFCCLATNAPVVNASKCSHTEFVKSFFKMQCCSELWICCTCHYMLKKIELFRFQVYKSFNHLQRKIPQGDSYWKLVNDLTIKNSVSILSIVKSEPDTEDYLDPLEGTSTTQHEMGIKSESDSDSESERTEALTPTVSDIQTSITPVFRRPHTAGTPHTATSQNPDLINTICLTPAQPCTRPGVKENPLLQNMLSTEGPFSIPNYIKVSPKPDRLPEPKELPLTVQDRLSDVKLEGAQESDQGPTSQISYTNQDDKIYSLLHKPSSVIDSTYEGKIMLQTMTSEQIEKEIEEQREKEKFKSAKHKCSGCVRVFNYEYELDRHKARLHKKPDSKSETECSVCKCVYANTTFKNHYKRHFTRFVCLVCYEKSTDLPKLALHFNQSHPEKDPIPISYWCNECQFKTDEILKYRQHRKQHRTQRCNICNKLVYVKMRIHIKRHHSDGATVQKRAPNRSKSYKCDYCDRTYDLTTTLRNHIKVCHSANTNTYYCKQCDKQFKTETNYRRHLTHSRVHASSEDVFRYICDICGKKAKYKDVMASHIETEHLKSNKYRCGPCDKVFGNEKLLRKHVRNIHDKHKLPKNKICQYCGKAFAVRATLRNHIRSHTGERPLKCDICEMTFAHDASLYTHRRLKHKIPRKRDLLALENEN